MPARFVIGPGSALHLPRVAVVSALVVENRTSEGVTEVATGMAG